MPIDLDAIQARVAQDTGIVHPDVVAKVKPGAVFEIDDKLVHFPTNPVREWHDGRRVVVVQAHHLLGAMRPLTVMVVPCSASGDDPGRADLLLPKGESGFTKPHVIAYASLVMPVLKTALTPEGYRGQMSDQTYGTLSALIAKNLGIGTTLNLPVRK